MQLIFNKKVCTISKWNYNGKPAFINANTIELKITLQLALYRAI